LLDAPAGLGILMSWSRLDNWR